MNFFRFIFLPQQAWELQPLEAGYPLLKKIWVRSLEEWSANCLARGESYRTIPNKVMLAGHI